MMPNKIKHHPKLSSEIKFWSLVEFKDFDSCWSWKGSWKKEGQEKRATYQHFVAARIMFKRAFRVDPGNLFVLHKCDNPSCVNPMHLFLGTHQDNMDDRTKKGRNKLISRPGSLHKRAKLNEEQVKEIRLLLSKKVPQTEIAKRFFVAKTTINMIAMGKTWTHVL